jgi:hypothetical protein
MSRQFKIEDKDLGFGDIKGNLIIYGYLIGSLVLLTVGLWIGTNLQ